MEHESKNPGKWWGQFEVPINYAYIILVDADKRWGKFRDREDAVVHLTKIIEDAYGKAMTGDQ